MNLDLTPSDHEYCKFTIKTEAVTKCPAFSCVKSPLPMHKCRDCAFETNFKVVLDVHIARKHREPPRPLKSLYVAKKYSCSKCPLTSYSKLFFVRRLCDSPTREHSPDVSHEGYLSEWQGLMQRRLVRCSPKPPSKLCQYRPVFGKEKPDVVPPEPEEADHKRKSGRLVEVPLPKLKVFKCRQCPFRAFSENSDSLKGHVMGAHCVEIDGVLWFRCERCPFRATHHYLLTAHLARRHEISRQFKCSHCSYEVKTERTLWNHIQKYHSRRSKHRNNSSLKITQWFQCSLCSFRTKDRNFLNLHEHVK